ncbi:hypothetical protein J2S58_002119 [Nakamurella flavida]|uniref:hypothetical protein n=1 Tax=Nakamurella flavida TaxID=363630 RepID=UPI002783D28F|nr:hypothetical protein [Nakamurella flavida]MDP9778496.1 hypothetical protein [Nakamurella flavida]
MLRVAARLHRPLLVLIAGLGVLALAALIVHRIMVDRAVAQLQDLAGPSCPQPFSVQPTGDCQNVIDQVVYTRFGESYGILHLGVVLLAIGLGALAGAPVFAREFEQRTQVLALTQSVGRTRWWVAKVLVVLVPLALVLLAVGMTATWAFRYWPFAEAGMDMGPSDFLATSFRPAVIGIVAAATGMTAGVLGRSTVGAIVVAGVLCCAVVYVGELARPHLATADRTVEPVSRGESARMFPQGAWFLRNGYTDAAGDPITWDGNCVLWEQPESAVEDPDGTETLDRCYALAGIAGRYTDTIPESRFWIVRTLWSGGLLVLSGLVLAVGWLRLRRRVL